MPEEPEKKTLYIFIDESGNFDFTSSGTKYFVLTAVSTFTPLKSRDELLRKMQELKYAGWDESKEEKPDYFFHATNDKQETRDWVFSAIKGLDDIEVDTIVAQKNKTNPSLYLQNKISRKPTGEGDWVELVAKPIRSEEKFYDKVSQMLLQYIFTRHENDDGIEKIVVVLGSIFTDKKRGYVLKSLKQYLRDKFKKPFFVYFRSTQSDINCQIADYCCWATYVKWERGETRPWDEIKDKVKSCFNVFRLGTKTYYDYP